MGNNVFFGNSCSSNEKNEQPNYHDGDEHSGETVEYFSIEALANFLKTPY